MRSNRKMRKNEEKIEKIEKIEKQEEKKIIRKFFSKNSKRKFMNPCLVISVKYRSLRLD